MKLETQSLFLEEADDSDLSQILEILNSNPDFIKSLEGEREYTLEILQRDFYIADLSGRKTMLIKKKDSLEIVGVLEYMEQNPDDNHPWIGYLVIDKNFQNNGYGSEVLKAMSKYFFDQGLLTLKVSVRSDNSKTINFFVKNSFKILGSKIERMDDGEVDFQILEKSR